MKKNPRTRKQFRKLQQLKRQLKPLEFVNPNKQVGKWAGLREMFTENKNASIKL